LIKAKSSTKSLASNRTVKSAMVKKVKKEKLAKSSSLGIKRSIDRYG